MIKDLCAISVVRAKCNGSSEESIQLSLEATDSLTEEEKHIQCDIDVYLERERQLAEEGVLNLLPSTF